jgi:hypothetical protein
MGRMQNKQRGFGLVEAVLAVAAIGIIGAAGVLVFQHNRTQNTGAASSPNPSSSQQIAPAAPAPVVAYLSVKEWNVKLPLAASIKDAYYTTAGSNTGSDGLPNTVWIGLTSLNGAGCNIVATGPSAAASPIGAIIRVLPTDRDPVSGALYTQQYPNGTTIDGFYFAYKPWNKRGCASAATLQSIDSSFAAAAKSTSKATTN